MPLGSPSINLRSFLNLMHPRLAHLNPPQISLAMASGSDSVLGTRPMADSEESALQLGQRKKACVRCSFASSAIVTVGHHCF